MGWDRLSTVTISSSEALSFVPEVLWYYVSIEHDEVTRKGKKKLDSTGEHEVSKRQE
jgi:hypothetical protein